MWLEIIVGGGLVTFTQAGTHLDKWGKDLRCEWAPRIEAEARRICGRSDGLTFACEKGDISIRLHEDAVPAVVRAITEAEASMPPSVQAFYQRVSYLLERGERMYLSDITGP